MNTSGQFITMRATFSAEDWKHFTEKEQQDILMEYRLCLLRLWRSELVRSIGNRTGE